MNKQARTESSKRRTFGKDGEAYTKWRHIKDGTGGVRGPLKEEETHQTPAEGAGGGKSCKKTGCTTVASGSSYLLHF